LLLLYLSSKPFTKKRKNRVSQDKPINNLIFGLAVGLAAVVTFIVVVVFITQVGLDGSKSNDDSAELRQERIKPVGQVRVEGEDEVVATSAPAEPPAPKSGKEVYEGACMACHGQGILGAPKFGDKEDWGKRYEQGEETLLGHAMNGFGQMPAQGGGQLSDDEVKAGMLYMLEAADLVSAAEPAPAAATTTTEKPPVVAGKSGQEVYELVCKKCHETGLVDAPKYGDKASWEPRLANKDDAKFYQSAHEGLNVMPPRGGDSSLTDEEVNEAVQFMLKAVGVDLPDPQVSTTSPDSETTEPDSETTPTEPETSEPVTQIDLAQGEKIYNGLCTTCHQNGLIGSPLFGDKDSWAPRIEKGMDALFTSALQGLGAMPPKGGNVSLPDEEVKSAVAYMVSQVPGVTKEFVMGQKTASSDATDDEVAPAVDPPSESTPGESASDSADLATALTQFDTAKGEQVYNGLCFACHGTGLAGSPILGNKESWAPRIEKGLDALFTSALQGLGAMPAKGGNSSLPDEDVKAAVAYMVSQVQ
jgi:cytochrome c5